MSSPIEKARKRLAEVLAEAEEIRRFLAMYDRFSEENVSGTEPADLLNSKETYPQLPPAVDSGDNFRRRGRRGPLPRDLVEMIKRLIREVGRPMTRGEIVEALNRREFEIPAKDKQRYVGTLAWRNKSSFVHVEGRGYWLRGEALVTNEQIPANHFSDPKSDDPEDGAFAH